MNQLLEMIRQKDASAFTHSGKFHADDVFSSALLLYLNPEITITRGNKVPDDFDGIVFDIGRGRYDHHQKDSRIRENGISYACSPGIYSVSEASFRNRSCFRHLPVQPRRLLYPATEKGIFSELQMQLPIRMAWSGK